MEDTPTFEVEEPDYRGIHAVRFLCPRCKGTKHLIYVWHHPAGETFGGTVDGQDWTYRVWNYKSDHEPGWSQRMTLTPSVDLHCKCGGWHGHIVNGQFNPA